MRLDVDQLKGALESDEALIEAAKNIYKASVETHMKEDGEYILLQGAEDEEADFAARISRELYDELDQFLSDSHQWSEMKAEQIYAAGNSGRHIAALAYIVHINHAAADSEEIPELIGSGLTDLSQEECSAVTERFSQTPMAGLFSMVQTPFPCLSEKKVRRLGVLLGMMAYGRCLELDDAMLEKIRPDISMEPMLSWGFAFAELMCSSKSERKDDHYAQAVSRIACADLSHAIPADSWAVLRSCLDSMCGLREDFYEVLREMTAELESEASEHIFIEDTYIADEYEQNWVHALERLINTKQESVEENHEQLRESVEDTKRETEEDHDFE